MKTIISSLLITLSAAAMEVLDPIILTAANGTEVKLVAIYECSPEGLTFSPQPTAPLIGHNKLQTMTTAWENIDTDRLPKELKQAYEASQKGETTLLELGPDFFKLSQAKEEVLYNIPYYRYGDRRISYKKLLTDSDTFRRYGNQAGTNDAIELRNHWLQIAKELKKIDYRPAASQFAYDLEKAAESINRLARAGTTFNASEGRNIENLLGQ